MVAVTLPRFSAAVAFAFVLLLTEECGASRSVPQGQETAVGQISFDLVTSTISEECSRGHSNKGIYAILEYRQLNADENNINTAWKELDIIHLTVASNYTHFTSNFTYDDSASGDAVEEDDSPNGMELEESGMELEEGDRDPLVQFRLVQWEHGGGNCNCWWFRGSWRVEAGKQPIPQELTWVITRALLLYLSLIV